MRYSGSEKFEIIKLVEQSTLSICRTLASIGIPRSTFYDWYSRYQDGGIEALEDGRPRPRRVWNKIPDEIGTAIVNLALEEPDLSPRELAVNFTDTKGSFVSEASVYRPADRVKGGLLSGEGLISEVRDPVKKWVSKGCHSSGSPSAFGRSCRTIMLFGRRLHLRALLTLVRSAASKTGQGIELYIEVGGSFPSAELSQFGKDGIAVMRSAQCRKRTVSRFEPADRCTPRTSSKCSSLTHPITPV